MRGSIGDRSDGQIVTVFIDTVSIRGLELANRDRLAPALAAELSELIRRGDRPHDWSAFAVDAVSARPISVGRATPQSLARSLAATIYREIRP